MLIVELDVKSDHEKVINDLSARTGVKHVERDRLVFLAQGEPDDERFPLQYNLRKIRMSEAWDEFPPGTHEVIVAVIDSG